MMRKIRKVPDPILHELSLPIEVINGYIKELAEEMLGILRGVRCIPCLGLAAVQLGEKVRMIAIMYNMYSSDFREPKLIINPKIIKLPGKTVESHEGCLSIGDGTQIFTVQRYKLVKVMGIDLNGERIVMKERQLPAFALQHEIDHLDGKLVSD